MQAADIMRGFPSSPGLYLHVPFCSSICPFCPYNKTIYRSDLVNRYFRALAKESAAYRAVFADHFTSLYIGGGTPTLCLDELASILSEFRVSGERAIEALPNHMTKETVAKLANMGINYVSLGIQSFDEAMLRHLSRPNSVRDNRQALDNSLGHFDCVDVDLIFDVAFQDERTFLADAAICFDAGVDQISTYPLMRFGYTPFGKGTHNRRREHEVLRTLTDLAANYGYERRAVWTFNKRGSPNYTSITREFYLGLGAGAATYTGAHFVANHFSVEKYADKLEHDELPVARIIALSGLRAAAYYLFWQFYTGSVDAARFRTLFPAQRLLAAALRFSSRTKYVNARGDTLCLTPKGYDLYHDLERWVTYHFIEPLWGDLMREHDPIQSEAANADVLPDFSSSAKASFRARLTR